MLYTLSASRYIYSPIEIENHRLLALLALLAISTVKYSEFVVKIIGEVKLEANIHKNFA